MKESCYVSNHLSNKDYIFLNDKKKFTFIFPSVIMAAIKETKNSKY
jgi:hypothetical protein